MDNEDEEELDYIDIFFINNKVKFKLDEMDNALMAITYIKNDIYWIIVNNFHVDLRNELIDAAVDFIAKSFYENEKLGVYVIENIVVK